MTATGCWPRVSRCRWCTRPVLRDNLGAWIHLDLAYVCRDVSGGLAPTTAEPEVNRRG
ncbi:hypothetical protein V6U90_15530 [Micromonospora sp. CPCC 206060]|uniref:hypothetical protein n=1 Tax=Micromonospora sp. CPCC 206060 TaxID=3122406 RepID=UPI002FF114EF